MRSLICGVALAGCGASATHTATGGSLASTASSITATTLYATLPAPTTTITFAPPTTVPNGASLVTTDHIGYRFSLSGDGLLTRNVSNSPPGLARYITTITITNLQTDRPADPKLISVAVFMSLPQAIFNSHMPPSTDSVAFSGCDSVDRSIPMPTQLSGQCVIGGLFEGGAPQTGVLSPGASGTWPVDMTYADGLPLDQASVWILDVRSGQIVKLR